MGLKKDWMEGKGAVPVSFILLDQEEGAEPGGTAGNILIFQLSGCVQLGLMRSLLSSELWGDTPSTLVALAGCPVLLAL